MHPFFYNTLRILLAITALIVVSITLFVQIYDINDFKPEIEAAFLERTGRQLIIEDELELSVFPWLGIATGTITVNNAAGIEPPILASIAGSDVKIKFISLFSDKIEVSKIILKGLVLNLSKTPDGDKNLSDRPVSSISVPLADKSEPVKVSTSPPPPSLFEKSKALLPGDFTVQSIAIEDAQIAWHDQLKNKGYFFDAVNLKTSELTQNKPVTIEMTLQAYRSDRKQASTIALLANLTVSEDFNQFAIQVADLTATTALKHDADKTITFNLSTQLDIDRTQQHLKVSGLQLTSETINLTAELSAYKKQKTEISGVVHLNTMNPRTLAAQLNTDLNFPADEHALSSLSANIQFNAIGQTINLNDMAISLDQSSITGSTTIENLSAPEIAFNLVIDQIDLDRYLPGKSQPTKDADKPTQARVDKQALPAAVDADGKQAPKATETSEKPAISNAVAAGDTQTPPSMFEKLRNLDTKGSIVIHQLKLKGLKMREVTLNVQAKAGIIDSQHVIKELYQGTSSGKIKVDVRKQQAEISIDEKISRVQIEPLLLDYKGKAKITGTLNAKAQLKAKGSNTKQLTATLSGRTAVHFKKGVVRGFDIQYIIDKGKRLIDKKVVVKKDQKQTSYDEISAHGTITNGLLKNDDLLATSENLQIKGKGSADLRTEQLDYTVVADLLNQPSETSKTAEVERSTTLYIKGDFDKPSYSVDLKSLITKQEKQKIYDKIDKKLGPDVSKFLKQFLR